MAKAPKCKRCGTAHWSTQACPSDKGPAKPMVPSAQSIGQAKKLSPSVPAGGPTVQFGFRAEGVNSGPATINGRVMALVWPDGTPLKAGDIAANTEITFDRETGIVSGVEKKPANATTTRNREKYNAYHRDRRAALKLGLTVAEYRARKT